MLGKCDDFSNLKMTGNKRGKLHVKGLNENKKSKTMTYALRVFVCILCVHSLKHSFSLNQMSREESALKTELSGMNAEGRRRKKMFRIKRKERQKRTLQIFRLRKGIQ